MPTHPRSALRTLLPQTLLGALAVVVLGAAEPAAAAPKVVYVHTLEVEKKLGGDGSGITSSLCSGLLKDKRLDVVCESDMKALMEFSNLQAMLGNGQNSDGTPVSKRLGQVEVIVQGKVSQGKHGLILDLLVAERDRAFDGDILEPKRTHGRLRIKGISGGLEGVQGRLERLAPRIAALTLAPPQDDKAVASQD